MDIKKNWGRELDSCDSGQGLELGPVKIVMCLRAP